MVVAGTDTGQQLGPGLPQVVFSPTPLGRFLVQSASTPCHPVPLTSHPGSAGGLLGREVNEVLDGGDCVARCSAPSLSLLMFVCGDLSLHWPAIQNSP